MNCMLDARFKRFMQSFSIEYDTLSGQTKITVHVRGDLSPSVILNEVCEYATDSNTCIHINYWAGTVF